MIISAQSDSSSVYKADIDTFHYSLAGSIYLDSIVISAVRNGFDISDFIKIIREDHSFEAAFHRIRSLDHKFDHSIQFFDKKNQIIASYTGLHHQIYNEGCRWMKVNKKEISGKFYKRKKYRYYTADLFSKLFYTKDTICSSNSTAQYTNINTKTNKRIKQLKTLIFNPGEAVDVPFIGKKLRIFSDKMAAYYDMKIEYENYQDSIPCFVFRIDIKDNKKANKKTVIKHLYTYISKDDQSIVAREYQLAYNTLLYDFDVNMKIQLMKYQNEYVPMYIKYDGNWKIVAKKREKAIFEVGFEY